MERIRSRSSGESVAWRSIDSTMILWRERIFSKSSFASSARRTATSSRLPVRSLR